MVLQTIVTQLYIFGLKIDIETISPSGNKSNVLVGNFKF